MAQLGEYAGLSTEDIRVSTSAAICATCCLVAGGGTLIA